MYYVNTNRDKLIGPIMYYKYKVDTNRDSSDIQTGELQPLYYVDTKRDASEL
jgi:hypothetical protein